MLLPGCAPGHETSMSFALNMNSSETNFVLSVDHVNSDIKGWILLTGICTQEPLRPPTLPNPAPQDPPLEKNSLHARNRRRCRHPLQRQVPFRWRYPCRRRRCLLWSPSIPLPSIGGCKTVAQGRRGGSIDEIYLLGGDYRVPGPRSVSLLGG